MLDDQMAEFGTLINTLSKVSIIVVNKPISRTDPDMPAASIQSPILNGRKNTSIRPAATLDKVPCNAKPIAKPAAPSTAMIEVVDPVFRTTEP